MAQQSSPYAKSAPLLVSPAMLFVLAFFVVPVAWCIAISFTTANSLSNSEPFVLTLGNYERFLGDSFYLSDVLWRTARLSLLATGVSVVIGYCGALLISRSPTSWQHTMIFLVMCPLWVNLVVRTLGLMVILNRDGPINQLLVGLGLFSHPVQLLFNEFAVWIGMVQVSVPFVVLSIYGVLKAIPKELEQSAMTVGANPIRAFMRVTLPLSAPGIGAGTVLALGLNMESFVVPVLLGGGRVHFMSIEAYETATVGNNMPFAATIGLLLLVVTLAILFAYQRLMGSVGRTHASITSS